MKHFNKWNVVKMTTTKKDEIKVYNTNLCPKCDKESLIQTNYCPNCGERLKRGDTND